MEDILVNSLREGDYFSVKSQTSKQSHWMRLKKINPNGTVIGEDVRGSSIGELSVWPWDKNVIKLNKEKVIILERGIKKEIKEHEKKLEQLKGLLE